VPTFLFKLIRALGRAAITFSSSARVPFSKSGLYESAHHTRAATPIAVGVGSATSAVRHPHSVQDGGSVGESYRRTEGEERPRGTTATTRPGNSTRCWLRNSGASARST
jgi:hypothetical protein